MPERDFLIFWFFLLFFLEFSSPGRVWMKIGTNFFFFLSFSAYLLPFWLKEIPESDFLIFWIFFPIFFWNFLAQIEYEWNSGLIFFILFLGLSPPVLAKNNAGKGFFNFFVIFFRNFLAGVEYGRNLGLKYFLLFLGLSHPVLAKNNAGKGFFNFLNSFAIFFEIFLPESCTNGIRD